MNKQITFLVISAVMVATILSIAYNLTAPMIKQQLFHQGEKSLAQLLDPNDKVAKKETFELLSPSYLHMGDMQVATRTYDEKGPSHIIIKTLARGYNGNIGLMLSLDRECTIGGVEILSEHETPGLGDQYKKDNGAWIRAFKGKNDQNAHFSLTHTGGDFDAWSGATVTPQAIVKALHEALELCHKYHTQLFSAETVVYAQD